LGLLLGILTNILGGTTYVLGKLALEGWPPATLVALRIVLSLPFLLATTPRGWRARATRADWVRLWTIGVLGLAVPHLLGVYGLRESDAMNGAILVGLEPVAIVILARIFLGERLRPKQIAGVLSAVAGGVLVVSRGDLDSALRFEASTRGALLLATQSVLWAVYTVAAKPTLERVPATALSGTTSLIALLLILPISSLEWPSIELERALAVRPLLGLLALGILVSYLATVLWNLALARIEASTMAILVFVQPLTGMVLSAAIGEPLPAGTLLGAALVFAGVWLSRAGR
jgi:drug/metabolite transporter (DMT)-like permease